MEIYLQNKAVQCILINDLLNHTIFTLWVHKYGRDTTVTGENQ